MGSQSEVKTFQDALSWELEVMVMLLSCEEISFDETEKGVTVPRAWCAGNKAACCLVRRRV